MCRTIVKLAVALILIMMGLSSCGVVTRKAVAIGQANGNEKELWIYLITDDADSNGVYRCKDDDKGVRCIKAKLKR